MGGARPLPLAGSRPVPTAGGSRGGVRWSSQPSHGGPPSELPNGNDTRTVRFTIDGRPVSARPGQTVLEVAREHGMVRAQPLLPPQGRAGGAVPRPASPRWTGCAAPPDRPARCPVRDGMVVRTTTERVMEARRTNVDCFSPPASTTAWHAKATGRCELQEAAYRLGIERPSFPRRPPGGCRSIPRASSSFATPTSASTASGASAAATTSSSTRCSRWAIAADESRIICDTDLPLGRSSCVHAASASSSARPGR